MKSFLKYHAQRYWDSFSFIGLVVATSFFGASVTPSLLPRHFAVQGVLSGFALAIGYGVGIAGVGLWGFLELPKPGQKLELVSKRVTAGSVLMIFAFCLWQMTRWQNSIRSLMEMEPLQSAAPFSTALIAIVLGAMLVTAARMTVRCCLFVSGKLEQFLPRRIAYVGGAVIVAVLAVSIANGVLAQTALNTADASFARIDETMDAGVAQPAVASVCGSADSLVEWTAIGRRGKNFIVDGPTAEELREFSGSQCLQPLRVYVGLRSRPTERLRAQLALEELIRVGGFDRSVLIVATPTGTGWLDPSAVDTVEYLHRGNTAIVSMQYSYLPSWLTIMVEPDRSLRSARALFDVVYDYWITLPKNDRPKLYVQGLSLGSLGSEMSADLVKTFEDPINGAVWSGPPFASQHWADLTRTRNAGTPAWLPKYRDGRMVRFTNQYNTLEPDRPWGPIRSVYLQYASDPMVFFSTDLIFKEPDWLIGERGPDVSSELQWYPIVTFLQVAFDLPMATSVPLGYGHNYAPRHYIDAWLTVTIPKDWSSKDTQDLKALFATRIPAAF